MAAAAAESRSAALILRRIGAVCFDLSGTIHIGEAAVGDAVAKLATLRTSLPDIPIVFLSNTSTVSKLTLADKLRTIGVGEAMGQELEEILLTSIGACAASLDPATSHPFLVVSDDSAQEFAGFAFKQLAGAEGVSCDATGCTDVVVALAPERMHYHALDTAFRVLQRPKARLIAAHGGIYQRGSDGELHLGPGPFVAALERAAEVPAEIMGKPSTPFLEKAQLLLEARAGRSFAGGEIAVVGDDARQDAGGAAAIGWTGVLVQTGKYAEGDADVALGASGGHGSLLVATDAGAFIDALVHAKTGSTDATDGCHVIE